MLFARSPSLVIRIIPLVLISNLPIDIHLPDLGLGNLSKIFLNLSIDWIKVEG